MALALARHLDDVVDQRAARRAIDATCLWAYEQGHQVPSNDVGRGAMLAAATAKTNARDDGPLLWADFFALVPDLVFGDDTLAIAWKAVRRIAHRRLKMRKTAQTKRPQ